MTTGNEPNLNEGSPRLTTFVVGVDVSPESLYSLDLAAAIGAPHDVKLVVVHVRTHPGSLGFTPGAAGEYEKSMHEVDDLVHVEVSKRLADYSGESTVVMRDGHVGHELLDVAEEVDADLVIIGHRSHGPVRDAILGSAAASTVHHSHRSVLVAIPPRVGD
ncbi:MAG: hypothetical protein DRJ50_12565 [Actinobacteria bacterium]|nr:MAG: hypothetical protein DRJ50_12565 [Actinomycetota bacterium]